MWQKKGKVKAPIRRTSKLNNHLKEVVLIIKRLRSMKLLKSKKLRKKILQKVTIKLIKKAINQIWSQNNLGNLHRVRTWKPL